MIVLYSLVIVTILSGGQVEREEQGPFGLGVCTWLARQVSKPGQVWAFCEKYGADDEF